MVFNRPEWFAILLFRETIWPFSAIDKRQLLAVYFSRIQIRQSFMSVQNLQELTAILFDNNPQKVLAQVLFSRKHIVIDVVCFHWFAFTPRYRCIFVAAKYFVDRIISFINFSCRLESERRLWLIEKNEVFIVVISV